MEPIRTPKRDLPAPRSGTREWLPYLAVLFGLMVAAIGVVHLHESGWRITIGKPTHDTAVATSPVRTIYACYDGQTGKLLYEQTEPCASGAASASRPAMTRPAYESASPAMRPPPAAADRSNPNQALIDAADARYRREVESARRAGSEQDRQRYSAQLAAAQATAVQVQQCRWLCESMADLHARMRKGYSARQSVYFHERQNLLFKRMQEQDCRACMD